MQQDASGMVWRQDGARMTSNDAGPESNKPNYPITTKLNRDVSSSWAYLPYSPRMYAKRTLHASATLSV